MSKQIRDKLIFEKSEYSLNQLIMNKYFRDYPERYIKPKYTISILRRGYVVTFEIIDSILFVKTIEMLIDRELNFTKNQEFDYKIPCDWYSGFLRIDDFRGEFDDEENPMAIYEFLEIRKGVLKKHHKIDHSNFILFKSSLFTKFKKSEEYQKTYLAWKNSKINDSEIEEIIYSSFMGCTECFE